MNILFGKLFGCIAATKFKDMGKILIVDSDRALRAVIANRLRTQGFEVHEVSSGWGCLRLLEHDDFSQILINERLNDMTGFEALDQMQERQANPPVLFLLEQEDSEKLTAALLAGACEVLHKPLQINQLLMAIQVCKAKAFWQMPGAMSDSPILVAAAAA